MLGILSHGRPANRCGVSTCDDGGPVPFPADLDCKLPPGEFFTKTACENGETPQNSTLIYTFIYSVFWVSSSPVTVTAHHVTGCLRDGHHGVTQALRCGTSEVVNFQRPTTLPLAAGLFPQSGLLGRIPAGEADILQAYLLAG